MPDRNFHGLAWLGFALSLCSVPALVLFVAGFLVEPHFSNAFFVLALALLAAAIVGGILIKGAQKHATLPWDRKRKTSLPGNDDEPPI
jgi:hypothetical protein